MVESEHLGNEVFRKNTNEPNLAVLNESCWSLVESIFAQSIHELSLKLFHVSIMQVKEFYFIFFVEKSGRGSYGYE